MLGEPGIDVASMPPMAACIANHEQASHSIFANRTREGKVLAVAANVGCILTTPRASKDEFNTWRPLHIVRCITHHISFDFLHTLKQVLVKFSTFDK